MLQRGNRRSAARYSVITDGRILGISQTGFIRRCWFRFVSTSYSTWPNSPECASQPGQAQPGVGSFSSSRTPVRIIDDDIPGVDEVDQAGAAGQAAQRASDDIDSRPRGRVTGRHGANINS